MSQDLARDIDAIFSVMPDDRSRLAGPEVLDRYFARGAGAPALVKWAEFDADGGFVRGGATDMADLSMRLASTPDEDADIAALVQGVSQGAARPGRLLSAHAGLTCHWYVLLTAAGLQGRAARLRGLAITAEVLGALMAQIQGDDEVTPAERRLLLQLLRGATVREAAEEDAVSFETKRAQVKSACAKLGCRGQSDLIRAVMGQLPQLMAIVDTASLTDGAIELFTRDYLAPDVRLVVHRLPNGRLLRVLEAGHPEGRPVVVAHGVMYPPLLLNCRAACEAEGLRIIMPMRAGYLDDQPTTALYTARDREADFEDVGLFLEQQFDQPVALAGHSLGAQWAIGLASRRPDRVSRLLLLSPHFASSDPSRSRLFGSFLTGLKSLTHTPGLYRYVAWQFRRYFADPSTVRRVLKRLFDTSPSDIRVLEAQPADGPLFACFASAYRSSIVGIADDMASGMRRAADGESVGPDVPVSILRAPEDPLAPDEGSIELSRLLGPVRHIPLPHGGHLVAASHPREFWAAVARELAQA